MELKDKPTSCDRKEMLIVMKHLVLVFSKCCILKLAHIFGVDKTGGKQTASVLTPVKGEL